MRVNPNLTLLKFSSSRCLPCKTLSCTLASMTVPFKIEEVTVEEDMELARMYHIRSVPALLLVDQEGGVVSSNTGAVPKETLEKWFAEYSSFS